MTIDKRRLPTRAGQIPDFAPVPRQCQRHDGWTPERQRGFIEALADTGSIRAAAHAVNMTPEGAYLLRRHTEATEFRKAWEAALSLGIQRLEDLAMDRALNGVDVPVYSYGKLIGKRTIYNDRLLMFLLRNRAPTRFAADGRVTARRSSISDPKQATELSRLKKKWRKEWEAEQQALRQESSARTLATLDAKLGRMQRNWQAGMTERTKALFEAYKAAEAEDAATGRSAFTEEMAAQDREDEDEAHWELAEEAPRASAHPEPAEDEPGTPRAMPQFLTQGDGETGAPRPTMRKRIRAALGAPEDMS